METLRVVKRSDAIKDLEVLTERKGIPKKTTKALFASSQEIADEFAKHGNPLQLSLFGDHDYFTVQVKDIEEAYTAFLKGFPEEAKSGGRVKYEAEIFDCEDFACGMKAEIAKLFYTKMKNGSLKIPYDNGKYLAPGFGVCTAFQRGTTDLLHAFNYFWDIDLATGKPALFLYEPQANKVVQNYHTTYYCFCVLC